MVAVSGSTVLSQEIALRGFLPDEISTTHPTIEK